MLTLFLQEDEVNMIAFAMGSILGMCSTKPGGIPQETFERVQAVLDKISAARNQNKEKI